MKAGANARPAYSRDEDESWSPFNFIRARITWLTVLATAIYVGLAIALPTGWLAEVLRCIQLTFSFMVLTGYWRRAAMCFFVVGRWPEKHNVIALGIEISWFSIFCNSAWAIFYRLAGQQSWMINNDYYTAWTAVSAFAACLHIFAPNMIGEGLPKLDKVRFGATGLVGLGLVLLVGVYRPDLSGLANSVRHLFDEPEWMKAGLLFYLTRPASLLNVLTGAP